MYYFLAITIFLLSLLEGTFRYSTIKNFFFIVAGVIFFIIQCYNTWSPDINSYLLHFELIDVDYVRSSSEPFHIFIIETVQKYGGDFQSFIITYGILIFVPLLYFIKKVTPLPVFVLSIFFFLPFFPDIAQLRNFLSFAFFFISIYFLNKKNLLFYIFIVLAILCHYSMMAMLLFFILRKLSFFNNYKKSNLYILVGIALLTLVPRQISDPLITAINPKYSSYLEATTTYLGTIALFIPFFILNNFVLYHYKNIYQSIEKKIDEKYRLHIPLFIQLIQFANYLILLQYFIRDFSRLTMNLSVLSYIYISILLFYGCSKNYSRIKLFFLRFGTLVWAILAFIVIFLVLNHGQYMEIIEKTFSSNSIYGK